MKIIVAITAASGSIYARQVVDLLVADDAVSRVALIYSRSAREVCRHEGVRVAEHHPKVVVMDNCDMFASVASGSAHWDAMVVVPCSVGTLARVASGISDTLITRAADVMLKERRRLVMVVREMPLSLVHLRNMCAVTEAGGVILPASPSMYGAECSSVEQLTQTVSRRAVELAGASRCVVEWSGVTSAPMVDSPMVDPPMVDPPMVDPQGNREI
ncbi:MAG: UbiX family flavin prenyltransferase [Rikenellaceae bacterium]